MNEPKYNNEQVWGDALLANSPIVTDIDDPNCVLVHDPSNKNNTPWWARRLFKSQAMRLATSLADFFGVELHISGTYNRLKSLENRIQDIDYAKYMEDISKPTVPDLTDEQIAKLDFTGYQCAALFALLEGDLTQRQLEIIARDYGLRHMPNWLTSNRLAAYYYYYDPPGGPMCWTITDKGKYVAERLRYREIKGRKDNR